MKLHCMVDRPLKRSAARVEFFMRRVGTRVSLCDMEGEGFPKNLHIVIKEITVIYSLSIYFMYIFILINGCTNCYWSYKFYKPSGKILHLNMSHILVAGMSPSSKVRVCALQVRDRASLVWTVEGVCGDQRPELVIISRSDRQHRALRRSVNFTTTNTSPAASHTSSWNKDFHTTSPSAVISDPWLQFSVMKTCNLLDLWSKPEPEPSDGLN